MDASKIMLEARHITKAYGYKRNRFEAVSDVSLTLREGEIIGIVGESGSGKSTLLRLLSCLEKSNQGELYLNGKNITGKKTKDICNQLQMIFQNASGSFDPRMTLAASIDEIWKHHLSAGETPAWIGASWQERRAILLQMVGLPGELAERYPSELSGGQCQRMAIARALAANPGVLLCDEITSALDVSMQAQIVSLLNDLRKQLKLSIIFVSHDLALTSCFCDYVLVMKNGVCVEEGAMAEVIRQPKQEYTKCLLDSIL